ncbi:type II toxin-antitoxin system HipA family toxin [Adlercreutzia sp. ZJ304]|uniref:type II toxin-antitoxin system HipA family toxin n=1 Tax=Adlercreutzia sp. ZJ304 TaxID=2709791 RepID=UPI0013ED0548|nr:type II toxin-antitoxin system HipA family toxin [Adlercreutzia sp. ZJ304]
MLSQLDVYADIDSIPVYAGRAYFSMRGNTLTTTFAYASDYLSDSRAYEIDPAFPLIGSTYHCNGLPGAFSDSAPDRWGRNLIDKEHRRKLLDAGYVAHKLRDVDYLVGVFDETREGNLRFREHGGDFLSESKAIPKIIQLPELLAASRDLAKNAESDAAIKTLLSAGSGSLGGARPKASVVQDGKLLLAKFPHPSDSWNVMAWEKTALDIARRAHAEVPANKLITIGSSSVLLLERFDRYNSLLNGARIAYISAMTLLGAHDGEICDYGELAEAISLWAGDPATASEELLRRILLSIALNNTDDHMRNHGFIRVGNKWQFSPLFDVNPNLDGNSRCATSILGECGDLRAKAAIELAKYMGIKNEKTTAILSEVLSAASEWKSIARKNGCSDSEIKSFVPIMQEHLADLRGISLL